MKFVLGKVGDRYQRKEYLKENTKRIFYKCLSEYIEKHEINFTDELRIQVDNCYKKVEERIYNIVHPRYNINQAKRKMSRIIKLIIN